MLFLCHENFMQDISLQSWTISLISLGHCPLYIGLSHSATAPSLYICLPHSVIAFFLPSPLSHCPLYKPSPIRHCPLYKYAFPTQSLPSLYICFLHSATTLHQNYLFSPFLSHFPLTYVTVSTSLKSLLSVPKLHHHHHH